MGKNKYDGKGNKIDALQPAKVLIAIPSGAEWKADFAMSVIALYAYCASVKPEGWSTLEICIDNVKGSVLSTLRTNLVKKALEIEATHVFFVDSDMTFPPFALHQLLSHKVQVVACNCVTKTLPANPTARMRDDSRRGVPLWCSGKGEGLKEVWRVGTGVMLIETDVFRSLDRPYFDIRWDETTESYVGEDWRLCERLEEKGIPIFIDQALSGAIGHLGTLNYGHEHSQMPTA